MSQLGEITSLDEVVDREALTEVCRSFYELFGVSVRVLSREGTLLADVHEERALCAYVNSVGAGHEACAATVAAVRDARPERKTEQHACFTGARYRVVPIEYQGRRMGRFIVGPYLPAESLPPSPLAVPGELDCAKAQSLLGDLPRVRAATAERITAHLSGVIDLILFTSHRAHLMSEMHVATTREGHRELAAKTAKLQAAYDKLKELDRLKSNFLSTVSHELRTPLTSIIGYADMLEAGLAGELVGEQRDFVHTIRRKSDHLLALITSLLDLGKLEQGTLALRSEPLHLGPMLREVAAVVAPQAEKKDVTVHIELAPALPSIPGDPLRVRQLLLNLADNAVKFTRSGGSVHLEAHAASLETAPPLLGAALMGAPRRAIAVSVRDTGVGIAERELPRIFDAFYQVDGGSTRAHGGVGLGLSIAKRLAEAHGGSLSVESSPGAGSTFTVLLPEPDEAR